MAVRTEDAFNACCMHPRAEDTGELTGRTSASCWGCGAVAPPGIKFQECERCFEENFASCYFCSKECFQRSWKRHRAWHKYMTTTIIPKFTHVVESIDRGKGPARLMETFDSRWDSSEDDYDRCLLLGEKMVFEQKMKAAAKVLRRAIRLDPTRPDAYERLAGVLAISGDDFGVTWSWAEASKCRTAGSSLWARAIIMVNSSRAQAAFCEIPYCWRPCCGPLRERLPLPEWMKQPEDFKRQADLVHSLVVRGFPDDQHMLSRSWEMQACAMECYGDFLTAGKCYIQAARLWPLSPCVKEDFLRRARECYNLRSHS